MRILGKVKAVEVIPLREASGKCRNDHIKMMKEFWSSFDIK